MREGFLASSWTCLFEDFHSNRHQVLPGMSHSEHSLLALLFPLKNICININTTHKISIKGKNFNSYLRTYQNLPGLTFSKMPFPCFTHPPFPTSSYSIPHSSLHRTIRDSGSSKIYCIKRFKIGTLFGGEGPALEAMCQSCCL